MKRVLFVDDEPHILGGLRRMLWSLSQEWEMQFADSGMRALEALAAAPFDVIVTDMRMPAMNGADLLNEVAKRYPQTVRIILSGQCGQDSLFRCVGVAHQFLSKPCDAEMLKQTITRACALRDLLSVPELTELVSRLVRLPSLPSLYLELMKEIRSPEPTVRSVAAIISKDVAMTARVLQLANSAFFGLPHHITDIQCAVSLLGMTTISGLVLSCNIFSQFAWRDVNVFFIEAMMKHSTEVGALTRTIADAYLKRPVLDDCFTAGILHDVGKLVLASGLSYRYLETQAIAHETGIPIWMAEREVFGATHAEVGAYMIGLWGLPDTVVEAVAYHHSPGECVHVGFCPLSAVHIADVLEQECHHSNTSGRPPALAEDYLRRLQVWDRLPQWRALFSNVERKAA